MENLTIGNDTCIANWTNASEKDAFKRSDFVGADVVLWARILFVILGIAEILAGVVGNLILLKLLSRNRWLNTRSAHKYYIANLAVDNLIIIGYWFTFFVLDLMLGYHPVVNAAHCAINGYIVGTCFVAQVLFLLSITLNRYLHVCHDRLYFRIFSLQVTIVWSFIVWVVSTLVALPPLFGIGQYAYNKGPHSCSISRSHPNVFPRLVIPIVSTLPMPLIAYCNYAIFRFWKRANMKVRKNNQALFEKHEHAAQLSARRCSHLKPRAACQPQVITSVTCREPSVTSSVKRHSAPEQSNLVTDPGSRRRSDRFSVHFRSNPVLTDLSKHEVNTVDTSKTDHSTHGIMVKGSTSSKTDHGRKIYSDTDLIGKELSLANSDAETKFQTGVCASRHCLQQDDKQTGVSPDFVVSECIDKGYSVSSFSSAYFEEIQCLYTPPGDDLDQDMLEYIPLDFLAEYDDDIFPGQQSSKGKGASGKKSVNNLMSCSRKYSDGGKLAKEKREKGEEGSADDSVQNAFSSSFSSKRPANKNRIKLWLVLAGKRLQRTSEADTSIESDSLSSQRSANRSVREVALNTEKPFRPSVVGKLRRWGRKDSKRGAGRETEKDLNAWQSVDGSLRGQKSDMSQSDNEQVFDGSQAVRGLSVVKSDQLESAGCLSTKTTAEIRESEDANFGNEPVTHGESARHKNETSSRARAEQTRQISSKREIPANGKCIKNIGEQRNKGQETEGLPDDKHVRKLFVSDEPRPGLHLKNKHQQGQTLPSSDQQYIESKKENIEHATQDTRVTNKLQFSEQNVHTPVTANPDQCSAQPECSFRKRQCPVQITIETTDTEANEFEEKLDRKPSLGQTKEARAAQNNTAADGTMDDVLGPLTPSSASQKLYMWKRLSQQGILLRRQIQSTRRRQCKREKALVRSLRSAFFLMLFSFFPFAFLTCLKMNTSIVFPAEVEIAVDLILFFNNAVNWVVYGAMNPSFRHGYSSYLSCFSMNICSKRSPKDEKQSGITQSDSADFTVIRAQKDKEKSNMI